MTYAKTLTRTAVTAALLAAGLSVHADDNKLVIRDFIGTVTVETGPDQTLAVTKKQNTGTLSIDQSSSSLEINGGINKPDGNKCEGYYGRADWFLFGKKERKATFGGYKDLDDYPKLTVTAPNNVAVIIENAIPFMTAGDIGRADIGLKYCGHVTLGDITGHAELNISGSGDIKAGDIGHVSAGLSGSGDLEFQNSQDVDIRSSGSSDVTFQEATSVTLKSTGSSDVTMGNISLDLDIRSSGSSDISVGQVGQSLMIKSSGSSDIEIDEANGKAELQIGGSGEVDIDSGAISDLTVTVNGSGEVRFDGTAENANLTSTGSGDIYVNDVTGTTHMKTRGSGDIDINN